jgi:hypothetical protein
VRGRPCESFCEFSSSPPYFVLRLAPEEPPILIPSMGSVAIPVLLPLSVLLVRPSPRDVLLAPTTPPWA